MPASSELAPEQEGVKTEPKFTPGPWHACHDGKCPCATVMAEEFPVATITRGDWGDEYPAIRLVGESSFDMKAEAYIERITYGCVSDELAAANVRLIASAPDRHDQLCALLLHGWAVEKRSLYDEEGVEGWVWVEPNGTEHVEIGSWDELPPWPDSAREALAKARGERA